MRILVISDLPHFVTGGAEMQAARLMQAWLDQGHEVICFGRRMQARSVTLGRHAIEVRRIRVVQRFGRALRALSYFASLALLLLRYRAWPDVVYCRFLNEAASTVALLKQLRLLRAPLVATPANAGGDGDLSLLAGLPFRRALIRLLDRQCDAINLIAPAMQADLRSAGFDGRNFSFIPNGIPIPPAADRSAAGATRLLFVGRLARQKGVDVLLRAFTVAAAGSPDCELRIVGDGPDRATLAALAESLGIAAKVRFLGELGQADVARQLAACDVFVLPSRYEGMSNAGLEAMAAGLPLLLTACGGLDTCVTPALGWVVPPGDEGPLAAALREVLATPREALRRMGAAARGLAGAQFAMERVAARYLQLFAKLAGRPVPPG